MRVIAGTARSRQLETLAGGDIVRPTTDKVKESLFNIIQFQIEGRRILDLFAGSGQLGIEALSRGADHCVFVDSSKKSIEVVKRNLQKCGFFENSTVVTSDSVIFTTGIHQKFDVALLDPPFKAGLLQEVLPNLVKLMNPRGTIVCESPFELELPNKVGDFAIAKEYKYGKIKLTVYTGGVEE